MTKQIELSKGRGALVSDEDCVRVNQYSWYYRSTAGGKEHAIRDEWVPKGGGKRRLVQMHRFILDAPTGMQVDHINHNRLDNRRENLRICTGSQNKMNSKKYKNSSSLYKGVSWCSSTNKWKAQIRCDSKLYYLGVYADEWKAAEVYNKAALEKFGEYVRVNKRSRGR